MSPARRLERDAVLSPVAQCCVCGFALSNHPDAGVLSVAHCGDCNRPVCGDHRDESPEQRCCLCRCVCSACGAPSVDAGDPEPPTDPTGYVEWEAVAGYVACCYGPDGDEPGDCYTRCGQDEAGWWWVDDGDDTQRAETYGPFASGAEARQKAAELAEEQDESDIAEERTADAERRRAEEEREEEERLREEEEARRAEEIDEIPNARESVWVSVDMDGRTVHGPGTYAEVDLAVRREAEAFRNARPSGDRAYLPRSIVRSDRGIRRAGQWSTRWINI